ENVAAIHLHHPPADVLDLVVDRLVVEDANRDDGARTRGNVGAEHDLLVELRVARRGRNLVELEPHQVRPPATEAIHCAVPWIRAKPRASSPDQRRVLSPYAVCWIAMSEYG